MTTLALRRLRRGESGTSALEFALVVPLLIVLLFGIIEFGRAMATYSTVVTASREAARFGSTIGMTDGTEHYRDCDGIREAADRLNIMARGAQIEISFDNGPGTTAVADCVGSAPSSITSQGQRVIVTVTRSFDLLIPGFSRSFDVSATDHRTIGGKKPTPSPT